MIPDRLTVTIHIEKIEIHIVQPDNTPEASESPREGFTAVCADCGWQKQQGSKQQQRRALAAHKRWCPGPLNVDVSAKLSDEIDQYFERNGTTTITRNGV